MTNYFKSQVQQESLKFESGGQHLLTPGLGICNFSNYLNRYQYFKNFTNTNTNR
jgi:hypothetical protein